MGSLEWVLIAIILLFMMAPFLIFSSGALGFSAYCDGICENLDIFDGLIDDVEEIWKDTTKEITQGWKEATKEITKAWKDATKWVSKVKVKW